MRKFLVSHVGLGDWFSENEIPNEVKELRTMVEPCIPRDNTLINVTQRMNFDGTPFGVGVHYGSIGCIYLMHDKTSTVSARAEWVKEVVKLMVDADSDDPTVNEEALRRLGEIQRTCS